MATGLAREGISPYLIGNFAPVGEEVDGAVEEIEGALPGDLAGHLLRVGPNPRFEPLDPGRYHPFDGDGMVHQVRFEGGRARYRNRWVRTEGFLREERAGRPLWSGLLDMVGGVHPDDMPVKNLANTALSWHAGRLLALYEASPPTVLRLSDLSTEGEEHFGGDWAGPFTAHPSLDPESRELVFLGYSLFPPYLRVGVLDPAGKLVHQTVVDLPRPVMIHDLAITPRFTLLLDLPVTFSLERAASGGPAFAWEPRFGARIGLLPRFGRGDEVRWFEVEPGYVFHTFNAFEDGDTVVLEACRSKLTHILDGDASTADDEMARLHRYRLDLASGRAREERVADLPLEFARIDERRTGRRHRYGFASRFARGRGVSTLFDGVVGYDRERDDLEVLELPRSVFAQEFVFAPRQGSHDEGDGYLVGLVHDEDAGQSEVWVLDARRLSEGPLARLATPVRVPYGFHSQWIGAEAQRPGAA